MTSQTASVSFDAFRTTDLRAAHLSTAGLRAAMPRSAAASFDAVAGSVQEIIQDVRTRGFESLSDLARKFDGVGQSDPRVPASALAEALATLAPEVRAALVESIDRARTFALAQKPQDVAVEIQPGAHLTQRWIAVGRVGLYVPGGLAVLASSVIMNVVPAQAAGVASIALASPPQKEFGGLPHPTILAAAALLGVTEVYAIGGAQAVAAFAYGVSGDQDRSAIEPVDVVTGPGNIYVAAAKRLVKGVVGIDAEAGTTEIAVLADETANPRLIAADLISQAEHDPHAASVLITPSDALAAAVRRELAVLVPVTRHRERVETALSGPQSGTILVQDLEQGIAVCDAYAAEHLEIHTAAAADLASRIRNAGAIFVGENSPVSLGDYCAGSNHVLPTAGTAAFASGLGIHTFLRSMQVVDYSAAALRGVSEHVVNLAAAEDLPGHGDAVKIRFENA